MSRFLAQRLRWFAAAAVVPWTVVLAISAFAFVTSIWSFEAGAYYTVSAIVAIAILSTTLVLLGVQERAGEAIGEPLRGAGLLGFLAAALALGFLWFVPGWAGLFLWATAATLAGSRPAELTSRAITSAVTIGLVLFGLGIAVASVFAVTGDALGVALWGSLAILALALIVWQWALAMPRMTAD